MSCGRPAKSEGRKEPLNVEGLTKTVIPTTSICPEVMPRYNSYTAPTTASTTGG